MVDHLNIFVSNIVLVAPSGVGKTVAAVIAAMSNIDVNMKGPQVLFLTLNFEAAYQSFQLATFLNKSTAIRMGIMNKASSTVNDNHIIFGSAMDVCGKFDLLSRCSSCIQFVYFDDADVSMASQKARNMVENLRHSKIHYISVFEPKDEILNAMGSHGRPANRFASDIVKQNGCTHVHYGIVEPSKPAKLNTLIATLERFDETNQAVVIICKVIIFT